MEIEVEIGKREIPGGYWDYRHYTNGTEKGIIYLVGGKCRICGNHKLDERDFLHILEHEYTELVCAQTYHSDGGYFWEADGFNLLWDKMKTEEAKEEDG